MLREVLRAGPALAVACGVIDAAPALFAAARHAPPWRLDLAPAPLLWGAVHALGWGAGMAMLLGFGKLGRDFEDRDPARPYPDA